MVLLGMSLHQFACVSTQFHSFTSIDLNGKKFDLEQLSESVVLVANVASECGYTDSHYKALQKMQDLFQPTKKFTVLAYPCNQFGGQEPGSSEQIQGFIQQFSVSFPVMSKVEVKGPNADPVWKYLVKSSGVSPEWNFFMYLVDGNGDVIESWDPQSPIDDIIEVVAEAVHLEEMHQVQVERPHAAGDIPHDEL